MKTHKIGTRPRIKLSSKVNGKPVSFKEACKTDDTIHNVQKFLGVLLLFTIGLTALYYTAEAQMGGYTLNDVKTAQNSSSFDLGVNMEALSKAVARHETNHCNSGGNFAEVGNCHGIRVYNGERLVPAIFPGYINGKRWETSYDAFIDLWNRKYGGLPTWEQAITYSGNDRTEAWHRNVLAFYDEYTKTNLTF